MNEDLDIKAIIKAVKICFPSEEQYPVGLHDPHFSGNEWKYVKDCLDTGWVSSAGKYVDKFETYCC